MPRYKVTSPRFHDGVFYAPGTKHSIITRDKPFPKDTKGVVKLNEETAGQRKKRLAAEAKAKKEAAEAQKEKQQVSESGMAAPPAPSSAVETL